MIRQFARTVTAHHPFRSPFRGGKRKRGRSRPCGDDAASINVRIRSTVEVALLIQSPVGAAQRAPNYLLAIEATIKPLVPFPHQGHRRPDLTSRPLRFTNTGNYLIAYAPDKSPLWVVAVMHGRRSPRVMAAIPRGRE